MSKIEFSSEQKTALVNKIQGYCEQQLDVEIGQFDAEFLLDFFSEEIGAFYYNQGLQDAQAVVQNRIDSIADELYEIEKPTKW
ncbi:hypothetical protein OAG1_01310 [Agarivorans sp. OAG1]|uniref:DUF2164 domain-containing protein n=1 Tax=unclassified Agarivorans TaxID=2636026 RepID=UPI00128CD335|nr:DUF2164 domain-containing protein [Agarivorans sp. B2Z047]MPW30347.1 DUF2164 family protein [Agarivorans sp. B2Z047]UQN43024.1 DUF2164 domain-containing protein [Agarivorans sp. B2Z047]BEU01331.1 hypothetical protein OAG1_01310 [Agarivorans sp. OAG1]